MLRFEIEILSELRVADRVALTAFQTLQRMGYGDKISALRRVDYFLLLNEGRDEADALHDSINMVQNTSIFANPNKHAVKIELKKRPRSEGDTYVVLTYPKDGLISPQLLTDLQEAGYNRVNAAGRGDLWFLTMAPDAGREIVEDIIVTRSREHGLLINPHSSDYEII